jgi:uncharacterized protein (DUF1330 family)
MRWQLPRSPASQSGERRSKPFTRSPSRALVIEIDVINHEPFFKEFVPAAVKTITEQGGKFLARGGRLVNIEGPAPVSSEDKRLTVVEFENMEKAQATFASPSYNEVRTRQ